MRFSIYLLMCTMPLSGMESIAVQLDAAQPVQQQAEGILCMCLNSSGDPLKPTVIPKLVEKINALRESNPIESEKLERVAPSFLAVRRNSPNMNLPENAPRERSLSSQEAFAVAEHLLATTLHEIIGDKDQAMLSEAQKRKWATVAAIAGTVGTIASIVAAILSSPVTQACATCICNSTII